VTFVRCCKNGNTCYNDQMSKKKKKSNFTKLIDDTFKIPNKSGNGIVKAMMSVDEHGRLARYSLAYVNYHLCTVDNGRVLGYDNGHGYHHRHFMGKEEPIAFESFELIAERFEIEWRNLHEKVKKT